MTLFETCGGDFSSRSHLEKNKKQETFGGEKRGLVGDLFAPRLALANSPGSPSSRSTYVQLQKAIQIRLYIFLPASGPWFACSARCSPNATVMAVEMRRAQCTTYEPRTLDKQQARIPTARLCRNHSDQRLGPQVCPRGGSPKNQVSDRRRRGPLRQLMIERLIQRGIADMRKGSTTGDGTGATGPQDRRVMHARDGSNEQGGERAATQEGGGSPSSCLLTCTCLLVVAVLMMYSFSLFVFFLCSSFVDASTEATKGLHLSPTQMLRFVLDPTRSAA